MSRLPAAERREQLLDRAAELFSDRGYARTTTAELAKAAGVTEPIIYRHFSSKRGLFIALIERTGKETLEQWEKDLSGASDAGERLRRVIGDNPMVSVRGQASYKVFLQAISEVDDPEIHKAIADHIALVHAFLANEIRLAQSQHKVTTRFSAEVVAWLLINIGMGYGVMTAMRIPGHGRDAAGGHVQNVLERILVGKDAGPKQA